MGGDIVSEETRKDVITLSHVGMEFHLNKEKVDSLKEYFIKLVKHDIAYTEFWALKDVTFSVKQGDRVGILGLNGAGKSTLMKVIAGVFKPTEGTIEKQGVLAPSIPGRKIFSSTERCSDIRANSWKKNSMRSWSSPSLASL